LTLFSLTTVLSGQILSVLGSTCFPLFATPLAKPPPPKNRPSSSPFGRCGTFDPTYLQGLTTGQLPLLEISVWPRFSERRPSCVEMLLVFPPDVPSPCDCPAGQFFSSRLILLGLLREMSRLLFFYFFSVSDPTHLQRPDSSDGLFCAARPFSLSLLSSQPFRP